MKVWTNYRMMVTALAFSVLATSIAAAGPRDVDFNAIAKQLVGECAAINEGDLVMVRGTVAQQELLESVAVQVRKRGAFPLLSITTHTLARRMLDEVPARFDTQNPEMALKLARTVDAIIEVTAEEDPSLMADVPPDRFAARSKAREKVTKVLDSRNVRRVYLGNGIYPTLALAKQFGMPMDRLTHMFWEGVNVDNNELSQAADSVRKYLSTGKTARITNKNGTDLSLRIERRPVHVSTGTITEEMIRKGGPACQTWLPAGEVFLAPVPGTAEGTVVVDRHVFRGREIRGLRLKFENGKLTSMTAQTGLEPLKQLFDASGPGKDLFAAFDVGVNPKIRITGDSKMMAWMASGMITVGIGNNVWAGGGNACDFDLFTHLPGSTLTVDGRTLIENGALKP